MKQYIRLAAFCLLVESTIVAYAGITGAGTVEHIGGPLEKMPPPLEATFALSALPRALRDKASVYLLDPARGYVLDHKGTNGQSCMVERTEWRWAQYRDDLYAAICYDEAGARSQMRVRFDVAELRAKGLSPEALHAEMERRFAVGLYKPPSRAGLSFMIAPLMRTYMSLDAQDKTMMTMVMPHIMYYAPNVSDADVGGLPPPPLSPYPFVFEQGPLGYIIQRLGDKEAAQILLDEESLLQQLCAYRDFLCVKADGGVGH